MRRNKVPPIGDYITMRQLDLAEERDKCHDEYDKLWYNRVISELYWVEMQIQGRDTFSSDCPLKEKQL